MVLDGSYIVITLTDSSLMESKSDLRTVFPEPQVTWDSDEEGSATLNGRSLESLKQFDTDEFPEGGLTAWTTALGV